MTVTGILTAIVIGLIIGALARLVLPGKPSESPSPPVRTTDAA